MSGPHQAAVPVSSATWSPNPVQIAHGGTPAGRHQSWSAETMKRSAAGAMIGPQMLCHPATW